MLNESQTLSTSTKTTSPRPLAWYQPLLSPQHGVYVVLFVSFLIGAAAAQQWTLSTTLALLSAFLGFQAEHPLALQIKQRRSWRPRFLFWGGLYGGVSVSLAIYLGFQTPVLWWLYFVAIAALVIDGMAVYTRKQRSIGNEIITFAAVCLATPYAYLATTGTGAGSVLGLWLLNTLYFCSTVFTVKLRKTATESLTPGIIYHAIASLVLWGVWYEGGFSLVTLLSFGVVLLKFGLIAWQTDWYKTTQIRNVAFLETCCAIAFLCIAAISLLPAHLPN